MSENKRFSYRIRKETTQYEIYDNLKTGEYPCIEPFFYKQSAKKICEFLNRQEERIQELEQFKNKVFNKIDENINECKDGEKEVFSLEEITKLEFLRHSLMLLKYDLEVGDVE